MWWPKRILLWLMAAFYASAGVLHFTATDFYLQIMPPYLPAHLELVWISGVAEIVLGLALLLPALRVWAAWGVIALLIAVFPANVYDVQEGISGASWIRLPLQGVFILGAWWYTRSDAAPTTAEARAESS
jgi:uncharacterized membrane protein